MGPAADSNLWVQSLRLFGLPYCYPYIVVWLYLVAYQHFSHLSYTYSSSIPDLITKICRQNLILLPYPSWLCQPILLHYPPHTPPTVLLSASKILSFLRSLCLAKPALQVLSLSWAITQCCFSSIDKSCKASSKTLLHHREQHSHLQMSLAYDIHFSSLCQALPGCLAEASGSVKNKMWVPLFRDNSHFGNRFTLLGLTPSEKRSPCFQ